MPAEESPDRRGLRTHRVAASWVKSRSVTTATVCATWGRIAKTVLEVRLLGDLEVVNERGHCIHLKSDSQRRLLTMLSLHGSHVVRATTIEDALCLTPGAVRTSISRLRRAVGADVLQTVPPGYRLHASVDLIEFDRLISVARSTDDPAARFTLESALSMWRGDPLAEFDDEPWARAAVQRLDDLAADATSDLVVLLLADGEVATAIDRLHPLIATHPYRDRPRALYLRALTMAGRRTEALREYQAYRRLLVNDIGTEPSASLAELDRLIASNVEGLPDVLAHEAWTRERMRQRGLVRTPPTALPVTAPAPPTADLPRPLTPFVGRHVELSRVAALISSNRLVTLTGAGGCGKTRLAVAAATNAHTSFANTWWVELSPVVRPTQVIEHVATSLGVTFESTRQPGTAPAATRRRAVNDRSALVVLDNAEHVLRGVAELVTLILDEFPNWSILVTSREPLGINGEVVWRVPSLQVPHVDRTTTVVDIERYDAIQLLVQRLRSVYPDFVLHSGNIDDVVKICRELDGLPFALELAAARTRSLPLDAVANGVERAISWQSAFHGGPISRHASLHACITASFDAIDLADRQFLTDLAVFRLPFTVLAAAAVGRRRDDDRAVEDALQTLVDSSLLEFDQGQGRYRMLMTIRNYCANRVAGTDEAHLALHRHATHVADWCTAVASGVHGIRRGPFVREMPEIAAALKWSMRHEPSEALRICAGLASVRSSMGYFDEAALTWDWLMAFDRDGAYSGEWAVAVAAMMSTATGLGLDVRGVTSDVVQRLPIDHVRCHGWMQRGAAMAPAYSGHLEPICAYADHIANTDDDIEISTYVGFAAYMTSLLGQTDRSQKYVQLLRRLTARNGVEFSVDTVGNGFAATMVTELTLGKIVAPGTCAVARRHVAQIPDDPVFSLTAAAAMAELAMVTMDQALLDDAVAWSQREVLPVLRYLPTFIDLVAALLSEDVEQGANLAEQYWKEAVAVTASRVYPLSILQEALICAGRIDAAEAMLDDAIGLVGAMDRAPLPICAIHLANARLACLAGRGAASNRHAIDLLDVATQHGYLLHAINALELIAAEHLDRDPLTASLVVSATHAERDRIGYAYRLSRVPTAGAIAPLASGPPDLAEAIRAARNLALVTS
jgi:predicted ATPase/DNA-binding SARP family transcriptional activator